MSCYNFEKLNCWKNAKELALLIYDYCDKYPPKENFGLTSQTTRATVSIAANIAEGCSRSSKKDFLRFLEISLGSAFELETLLLIANGRNYIDNSDKIKLSESLKLIIKQIYGLKRSLNEK
jgi:four helix bundle protein